MASTVAMLPRSSTTVCSFAATQLKPPVLLLSRCVANVHTNACASPSVEPQLPPSTPAPHHGCAYERDDSGTARGRLPIGKGDHQQHSCRVIGLFAAAHGPPSFLSLVMWNQVENEGFTQLTHSCSRPDWHWLERVPHSKSYCDTTLATGWRRMVTYRTSLCSL